MATTNVTIPKEVWTNMGTGQVKFTVWRGAIQVWQGTSAPTGAERGHPYTSDSQVDGDTFSTAENVYAKGTNADAFIVLTVA